jgi:hypothetical protein
VTRLPSSLPPRQVFAEDCAAYHRLAVDLGPDHVARPLYETPPPADSASGVDAVLSRLQLTIADSDLSRFRL